MNSTYSITTTNPLNLTTAGLAAELPRPANPKTKTGATKWLLTAFSLYLRELVNRGGPEPDEFSNFTRWIDAIAREIDAGRASRDDVEAILSSHDEVFGVTTMQGFSRRKPHGYSGDFEIIDRIYRCRVSPDPKLANWDRYFHAQIAPIAVRNRKTYFIDLLTAMERESPRRELRVLNLASGPCRDLFEFFNSGDRRSVIDCVEQDQKAIDHGKNLCREHMKRITFHRANVLRYRPTGQFDLIWSAGLFDYLSDRAFRILLKHYLQHVADGGQFMIGNYSPDNPSRSYMEIIGDWHLFHRSGEQLTALALDAGIDRDAIEVRTEPERLNLFLHITK